MAYYKLYDHWDKFPMSQWRWKDFQPWEVATKDGINGTPKSLFVDPVAMDALQELRDLMGTSIIVTSAFRTKEYNRRIGGATKSKHILAQAFDIIVSAHDPAKLYHMGKKAGFNAFGFYERSGFIHMDIRKRKTSWGKKWFGDYKPSTEVAIPDIFPEPESAKKLKELASEISAQDRPSKSVIASVAGAGTAGVTVAGNVLSTAETAQDVATRAGGIDWTLIAIVGLGALCVFLAWDRIRYMLKARRLF